MSINADTLLDRLHLKSQVSKWRLLAIAALVVAALVWTETFSTHSPMEREFVARLSIDGVINDDRDLYDLLDDVEDNPKIKGVILSVDSPGGSAVGGQELYVRLKRLSEQKPMVAVIRNLGASAGYMAALGAERILAREGSITGSIGVVIQAAEVTELADKIGIKPITIKSGALKDALSPLHKQTPEASAMMQDLVNDFYNVFVDMVAERRGMPREKVLPLADGRVFSGRQALQHKLIDGLGGEEEAMQWLVDEKKLRKNLDIRDIKVKPELSLAEALAQEFSGKFFGSGARAIDGLVAIWHPSLQ